MQVLLFTFLVAFIGASVATTQRFNTYGTLDSFAVEPCNVYVDPNIVRQYRDDQYTFSLKFYKAVIARSNLNFIYSPLSIWITLAALAEGAEPSVKQHLFDLLSLPSDLCTRKKYYQLATSRFNPSDDVKILSNRVLLVDHGVSINPTWFELVQRYSLVNVLNAPIRHNPNVTANVVKRIVTSVSLPRLNLNGNSVLLDTFEYNALWTTEFADASIERAPFYNQIGHQVGFVDLMRVKRRARIGYVESQKAKALELPVGLNERYRMIFLIFNETDDIIESTMKIPNIDIAYETFDSIKESAVPIDVAIPRIVITSEIDVKTLVEDIGVTSLWNDPAATRNVSFPPAQPSSFIQRATVLLNNQGLFTPIHERDASHGAPTGLHPKIGNEFIVNRPFLFALFDSETLSSVMASGYSEPTYKN